MTDTQLGSSSGYVDSLTETLDHRRELLVDDIDNRIADLEDGLG
jgi:hypothetical protein